MAVIYNLLIHLYQFTIHFASFFNPKAKQWITGRKGLYDKLISSIDPNTPIAWFHAASLGEFEQGRPVIEAYKKKYPEYKILLSFFSPSGYNVRKNYNGADYVFYLPIDTRKNAKRFISIIKPRIVFFIKYEYWYNYLSLLKKKQIPVYNLSANFRPNQYFFKWYGKWFSKRLKDMTQLFVQNEQSEKLLITYGFNNCTLSGDTRFDRVYEAAQHKQSFPLIEKFCKESKVLLAGSSWPEDEVLIYQLLKENIPDLKIIIAPHEVNKEHINTIIGNLNNNYIKYSELTEEIANTTQVMIIDTIGILLHLYQYATIAYIGGGFSKGIHNILEAATFGKPVHFGPNYHKFEEAKSLIDLEGAFSVKNYSELKSKLNELLNDPNYYHKVSETCRNFILKNRGATERILGFIG
ncbi:3-deoxy-D-manno-octulosonic acid transferase [candidate division KSB1 bacterium]